MAACKATKIRDTIFVSDGVSVSRIFEWWGSYQNWLTLGSTCSFSFCQKRYSGSPKVVFCIQSRSLLDFVHRVLHNASETSRLPLSLQSTGTGKWRKLLYDLYSLLPKAVFWKSKCGILHSESLSFGLCPSCTAQCKRNIPATLESSVDWHREVEKTTLWSVLFTKYYSGDHFFPPQCHHMFLWTFVVSLLVVAIVQPTSEVGTPMRRDYVVPMMWVVICREIKYQEGP